jgi:hypothetical protein
MTTARTDLVPVVEDVALNRYPDPAMSDTTAAISPFHLAFPVHDIAAAREFYGDLLGCPEGRSSADWVDFAGGRRREHTPLICSRMWSSRHTGLPGSRQSTAITGCSARFAFSTVVTQHAIPGEATR